MKDKREQKIKEKSTIREMVKVLEDFCHSEKCKRYDCNYCNCETLYNAGYRKQSEIAKEIIEELKQKLYYLSVSDNFLLSLILKKYGVEL